MGISNAMKRVGFDNEEKKGSECERGLAEEGGEMEEVEGVGGEEMEAVAEEGEEEEENCGV